MNNPSPPEDFYIGDLERVPAVAVWLGAYVADFAALELCLVRVLSIALNEQLPLAHAICGRIQSIPGRIEIARALLTKSNIDEARRLHAIEFLDGMLEHNRRRNELVHGIWESDATAGTARLRAWALSSERKTKPLEPITPAKLKKSVFEVRRLLGRTYQQLFRHPGASSAPATLRKKQH